MLNLISNKIVVEYAEPSSTDLYADIFSSVGGNPAVILDFLNQQLGFIVDADNFDNLAMYCNQNNYLFARYIDSDQDIYQLMLSVAESLNSDLFSTSTGLKVIRKRDKSNPKTIDKIISKTSSYAEIYSYFVLNYGNSVFDEGSKQEPKTLIKSVPNAKAVLKEERQLQITSEWIQDESVAKMFLDEYALIQSTPREQLTLEIPSIYELENGDTILFEQKYYRLMSISKNVAVSQSVEAIEII